MIDDRFFMGEALKEARKAFDADEVPIGAIIVYQNKIIARAHNQVRRLKDPTAHAEILAITQASSYLGYERLNGSKIYATIEPCIMCAGAILLARFDLLLFGASDNRLGAFGSLIDVMSCQGLIHTLPVKKGIAEKESAELIQEFFRNKRVLMQ